MNVYEIRRHGQDADGYPRTWSTDGELYLYRETAGADARKMGTAKVWDGYRYVDEYQAHTIEVNTDIDLEGQMNPEHSHLLAFRFNYDRNARINHLSNSSESNNSHVLPHPIGVYSDADLVTIHFKQHADGDVGHGSD